MRLAASVPLLLGAAACTRMLGIDGEYVVDSEQHAGVMGAAGTAARSDATNDGSNGPGGAAPQPDASASGAGFRDAGPRGGASHDATIRDAAADASCGAGKKRCPGVSGCVEPDPSIGCSLDDCTPCPAAPDDGFALCDENGRCNFDCKPGFVRGGSSCTPEPTGSGGGGQGGSGGSGGTAGACDPRNVSPLQCPPCISKLTPVPFPGCCDPLTSRCGCLYVAWCQ